MFIKRLLSKERWKSRNALLTFSSATEGEQTILLFTIPFFVHTFITFTLAFRKDFYLLQV